jgi:hypothetical protein
MAGAPSNEQEEAEEESTVVTEDYSSPACVLAYEAVTNRFNAYAAILTAEAANAEAWKDSAPAARRAVIKAVRLAIIRIAGVDGGLGDMPIE